MSSIFGGSVGPFPPPHLFDRNMAQTIHLSNQAIYHPEQKRDEILQPFGKKRRRVHFDATACKMSVAETVKDIKEVEERWISQDQLRRIQKKQKHYAAEILDNSPNYCSSILALMETHKCLDEDKKMNLKRHISCVAETDCRGLERHIVTKLNYLRKEHVRITLSLQRQLRERGMWDTDHAQEMIRKRSASISRPLRQLASHLAQADEWEARQGTPYRVV